MNPANPTLLLNQMAQIQRMERGKLTVMRQGPDGPYYKLQVWENGKNLSRYVERDQAAAVQEAIDGYQQFQALTGEYAQGVIDRTRAELAGHAKKKKYHRHRLFSKRRTRKSSN
jgi:hypothetical protein